VAEDKQQGFSSSFMLLNAVRRLAGVGTAAERAVIRHRRPYAIPSTHHHEPDPQLNGYPELPSVSKQYLPVRGWWDEQNRRNFGETVSFFLNRAKRRLKCMAKMHEKEELYSMWGPDIPVVPPQTALYQFTLVTLGFVGFGLFANHFLVPEIPAVRREYPFSGLVTELGGVEENKVSNVHLSFHPLHSCLRHARKVKSGMIDSTGLECRMAHV
jgi:NADH dehydrogenase (ubiquinone) 1 beta subcomplex subunit 8